LSASSSKESDIATERLAEIYTLQGLHEKAIETYKKLILKYPERSSIFAQKIQELQAKKINK
jgi:tetratricopeptide (TPR) repeat protein